PPTTTSPMTPVFNEPFNIDGFRLTWPAEQFRHKGPTALDEIRREPPVNETPQFGFTTGRRFTGFPVLSMALAPMVRLGANNVSMLPPGNHPYAAFAPDAPWEISYDGVLYLDQATLIYSMVWHAMTASLSELHHTSVEERLNRRGWCLFSIAVHRLSLNYSYISWISTFLRLIADAIVDCAWAMLPPNMRIYFAGHPDMAPHFAAEPPSYLIRRRN
ncbi:ube2z, partial [Symbiodinium necroappetens]